MPTSAQADTFGSGTNTFTIDFVTIGNADNGDDVDNPYPNPGDGGTSHGGVGYEYRLGVTEAPQDWITHAMSLGMMNFTQHGIASQYRPTVNMDWYNAAVFVNWLNTSTGHQPAYNLTFSTSSQTWSMALWSTGEAWHAGGENLYRHKNAYYFLPSEDEWYKAAYHQNDGITANYWDYATDSNSVPTAVASGTDEGTTVYAHLNSDPAAVDNNGGLSPYGTRGQDGNVWEWQESALDGINDDPF